MNIVITVSRQLGSYGSYIAADVAKRLELRYIDREILYRAAEVAGYPDEKMVSLLEEKEHIPGLLEKLVNALNAMPLVPTVPSATLREGIAYNQEIAIMIAQENLNQERRQAAGQAYVDLLKQVIEEYAQAGNVIIVGRGGQVVLRNASNALHIRIQAPLEARIVTLMERSGLNEIGAEQQISESDKQRSRYMKHYYDVDWNDPTLYHLTLNTAKISPDLATHLICETAQRLAK